MKSAMLLILISMLSFESFCQSKDTIAVATDTITTSANLDYYVDKLVTIKGQISNTKIPQICGIDVSCDDNAQTGKIGISTGILTSTVVLEKDVDPYSANRGAGTFYRLIEPETDLTSKVIIVDN